jgi:RES domain-containing protein
VASRQQHFEDVFKTLGQPLRGSFVRGVPLEYSDSPLSAIGSLGGGRYNAAGTFQVLYLGENSDTVAREARLIVLDKHGHDASHPQPPKIIMTIEYELRRVADLNDLKILGRLGVKPDSLLTEWTHVVRAGKIPTTQRLGAAAYAAGLEGLVVPSKRHPGRSNIAVIEDNLLAGSFVQIHDPVGFDPPVQTRIEGRK